MIVHSPNIALFSDDGPMDMAYMAVVIASVPPVGAAMKRHGLKEQGQ